MRSHDPETSEESARCAASLRMKQNFMRVARSTAEGVEAAGACDAAARGDGCWSAATVCVCALVNVVRLRASSRRPPIFVQVCGKEWGVVQALPCMSACVAAMATSEVRRDGTSRAKWVRSRKAAEQSL
mmetsp:Transcript_4461/g.12165  ORF Transcript_4461/g.12165 Transcript_4461/m.12165 type:complete len:129 (-) Transcript_4461:150-536(-)